MTPAEFMRTYEAATNAHDIEELMRLIGEDAVYLFSDQSSHLGKPAIRNAIARNFAAIESETYRIDELTWLASSEDVAACVYEFSWSGVVGGQPASGGGRGTTVIRRIAGEWRIVHEHLSRGRLKYT